MPRAKTLYPEYIEEVCLALSKTDDPNEIREFLNSILTPNEVAEISSRWALVKLIDKGETQRRIAGELHLSLCKITRGSKELKKENSAFRKMIEKIAEAKGENQEMA